jgi:hypothetical protein
MIYGDVPQRAEACKNKGGMLPQEALDSREGSDNGAGVYAVLFFVPNHTAPSGLSKPFVDDFMPLVSST